MEYLINVLNKAESLLSNGDKDSALILYKSSLKELDPHYHYVIYLNIGVILFEYKDLLESELYFRHCIFLNSQCLDAYFNLSSVLEKKDKIDDSIDCLKLAISFFDKAENDDVAINLKVKIFTSLGRLLELQKLYSESEYYLYQAVKLDNSLEPCWTHLLHSRQRQCKWPIFDNDILSKKDTLNFLSPVAAIAETDDLEFLYNSSARFVENKVFKQQRLVPFGHRYNNEKIKIAFLSSNLNTHAISLLTVQLIEKLNRNLFSVYAFSWSPEENTFFSQRVERAFDHFFKVGPLTDEQIAHLIISHQIDMIIDLQSLTSGARLNLISYGCAPYQISFLGYPGTSCIPHVDYIIVDHYLYDDKFSSYYSEKPLYIDDIFQPCDNNRIISDKNTRDHFGLPEDKFVFACFNNIFKIKPEIFTAWMTILLNCEYSILWLLDDNEWSTHNLKEAARFHGVDPNRLVFAGRILPEDYLARFQAADLYLDTFPFNGGTTANDVLWAGLPLLTLSGNSFASRMAGALLHHLKLFEFITSDIENYIKKAIYFYNNPDIINHTKINLRNKRIDGSLFNSDAYVNSFEVALVDLFKQ
jgi:predicted O-linked N-acetylglucosamine transferase (SPINDLY family)